LTLEGDDETVTYTPPHPAGTAEKADSNEGGAVAPSATSPDPAASAEKADSNEEVVEPAVDKNISQIKDYSIKAIVDEGIKCGPITEVVIRRNLLSTVVLNINTPDADNFPPTFGVALTAEHI